MKLYYQIDRQDGSFDCSFHEMESLEAARDAVLHILTLIDERNARLSANPGRTWMEIHGEDIRAIESLDSLEDYIEEEMEPDGLLYYCLYNRGWFHPENDNYIVVYHTYSDYLNEVESYIMVTGSRYDFIRSPEFGRIAFNCAYHEVYFTKGMAGDNCWYRTGDGYVVHEEVVNYGYLYYSDVTDTSYLFEDNLPEEEEEEEEVYTDSYHSRNSEYYEIDPDFETPYKIGFEAEKEDADVKESVNIYEFNRITNNFWRKERDSSLDDHEGFELISPFMKLDADRIMRYINSNSTLVDHINADTSKRCGGHIHLSHRNLSGSELYDTISGYFPIVLAMYRGRIRNSYSAAGSKDDMKRGGRMAINVKSDRIEIRVFSAIKSVDQLRFRLKLLQFICSKPSEDFKTALDNIRASYKKLFSGIYDRSQFNAMIERAKVYSVDFEFATSEEINN